MKPGSVTVVIPARNAAQLLPDCVGSLVAQIGDQDRIVVVNDGSTDETGSVARALGADVLNLRQPVGPYAARQIAAERADSEYLLFFDARCRAAPGLVQAHKTLLASGKTVMLSATDVLVVAGQSAASRVAAVKQPFRLDIYFSGPELPYFPTCNLGLRRDAFMAVGGFALVRSGGDAELCWRIQQQLGGRFAVDERSLVTWQPRDQAKELLEQWFRYGRGRARLQAEHSWPREGVRSRAVRRRRTEYLRSVLKSGLDFDELVLLACVELAFRFGAFRQRLEAGMSRRTRFT